MRYSLIMQAEMCIENNQHFTHVPHGSTAPVSCISGYAGHGDFNVMKTYSIENNTKRESFATRIDRIMVAGDGPFNVRAFELTHDGECWSVNTSWLIARNVDREHAIQALQTRWEIYKVNYDRKARICDITDISDEENQSMLEVNCNAFANIEPA